MADIDSTVEAIAAASSLDSRVSLIRRIPEDFGTAQHAAVYSAVAKQVYVPDLAPDFAYVSWREDYELEPFMSTYDRAAQLTSGFTKVNSAELVIAIEQDATTLRIFRVLLGFTPQEFAAATAIVAKELELPAVGVSKLRSLEAGTQSADERTAGVCAELIHRVMTGVMFEAPVGDFRTKLDKPDTAQGWVSVRRYAEQGVPFGMFLHQRQYGGAFRQLLDATSTRRGNILEDAVEQLLEGAGVSFVRTGSHNQAEIERKFSITVKPAPDFVIFDGGRQLRAILECKGANDGGTARDKAARFRSLRTESNRLGGVPLVAVLSGLGWTRTMDALGPVIRDTDGRVFTLANLPTMLSVEPFTGLAQKATKELDR